MKRHPFFASRRLHWNITELEAQNAMQFCCRCRGQVENNVTKKTNFLVLGEQDFRKFAEGHTKSSKLRKAETVKQEGQDIELLSERDYLEMLGRETA